jgi:hypothetical protein
LGSPLGEGILDAAHVEEQGFMRAEEQMVSYPSSKVVEYRFIRLIQTADEHDDKEALVLSVYEFFRTTSR